ncbi:hypothetical protein KL909_005385 [Ogataea angusta]|nr:hypothetical protein KL909_005385 [Ogataea angusta]
MVLQRWEKTEPFYSPSKIDIGECGSLNAAGNEQVLGLVELERQAKCWHPKDAFAGSIEKRQTHLPMHDFFSLSSCISVPFPQTLASRDPNQTNDLHGFDHRNQSIDTIPIPVTVPSATSTHVKTASGMVFGLSCSERCRNQIHKFAAYYREYEIADREAETGGNTRDFVLWSSPA